ncbi:MAG: hypothetical protein HY518_00645 [Candidatus Aenigmarchaeota archaeon]|nr:hypothetical protein [Candidatus Aenigmarchaeota archaeon]
MGGKERLTEEEFFRIIKRYDYKEVLDHKMGGDRKKIVDIVEHVKNEIHASEGFMSRPQFISRVREIASSRGIPPDVALKVLKELGY